MKKTVVSSLKVSSDPNRGPSIQFISGINGIAPGGTPTINFGNDRRYLGLDFQCAAVNYTGGNALTTTKIASITGAGLTVNLTSVPERTGDPEQSDDRSRRDRLGCRRHVQRQ